MNVNQLLNQYTKHTGKLPGGEHFVRIGNNVCDVFSGKGWTSPTRYRLSKGAWVYQHGPKVNVELNGHVSTSK